MPKRLARKAMKMCTCSEDAFLARSYVMEPKSFQRIQGFEVSAIAAYNILKLYHPKINPEIAIPIHYGSIVGTHEDEEVFAKNVNNTIKVEFKIPFEGR